LRAGARGVFDVEFDLRALFEVQSTNVLNVKEYVVFVVSRDETVAAGLVEEINSSFYRCNQRNAALAYTASESRGITGLGSFESG
jgi:hypothetical protein